MLMCSGSEGGGAGGETSLDPDALKSGVGIIGSVA